MQARCHTCSHFSPFEGDSRQRGLCQLSERVVRARYLATTNCLSHSKMFGATLTRGLADDGSGYPVLAEVIDIAVLGQDTWTSARVEELIENRYRGWTVKSVWALEPEIEF